MGFAYLKLGPFRWDGTHSDALANDLFLKSEFEYFKKGTRGRHILKISGDQKPGIDDVLIVTLDKEVIGKLKVLRVYDEAIVCQYSGETLLEGRLKDYRFQNIGKQNQNFAAALLRPDPTIERLPRPQIEILTGGSGGQNHLLDLALSKKTGLKLNSLDLGLRYSLPEFEAARWLNWFYAGVTVNIHTLTATQTVAKDRQGKDAIYGVQDTSRSIRYQAGLQVPSSIPLFSTIDVYGIVLDERHSILLTKQQSLDDDIASIRTNETGYGAATSLRVLKGMNIQFFFESSISREIYMTSEERVLEDTKGTGKRSAFGLRPSYSTGIWDFKPRLFLKAEIGLGFQSTQYDMTTQETGKRFSPAYHEFKPEAALVSSLTF